MPHSQAGMEPGWDRVTSPMLLLWEHGRGAGVGGTIAPPLYDETQGRTRGQQSQDPRSRGQGSRAWQKGPVGCQQLLSTQ